MTKKETFKWIVQIIASVATAILTAHKKSVLESDFPERFIYVNLEKMNNGKCDFNK